jgi:hypothetical protein
VILKAFAMAKVVLDVESLVSFATNVFRNG